MQGAPPPPPPQAMAVIPVPPPSSLGPSLTLALAPAQPFFHTPLSHNPTCSRWIGSGWWTAPPAVRGPDPLPSSAAGQKPAANGRTEEGACITQLCLRHRYRRDAAGRRVAYPRTYPCPVGPHLRGACIQQLPGPFSQRPQLSDRFCGSTALRCPHLLPRRLVVPGCCELVPCPSLEGKN